MFCRVVTLAIAFYMIVLIFAGIKYYFYFIGVCQINSCDVLIVHIVVFDEIMSFFPSFFFWADLMTGRYFSSTYAYYWRKMLIGLDMQPAVLVLNAFH